MTISHCDHSADIWIFSHISANIRVIYKGAGYPGVKCANQHLTAGLCIFLLGMRFRSVSVTPCIHVDVRDNWKGRAVKTALTDRRRQSCRTPSKPSWPLAYSLFLQLVRSKKSPWKSPWSWKSLLWRSSNLELLSPGQQARHQADWRHSCLLLKRFLRLACSLWSLHAPSRKKPSWSMNRSWQKRQCRSTEYFLWPGAVSARPKPATVDVIIRGQPC